MASDLLKPSNPVTTDNINLGGAKPTKPFYKRVWFIVVMIIVLLVSIWMVLSVVLAFFNVRSGNFKPIESTTAVGLPISDGRIDTVSLYSNDDPSLGNPAAAIQIVEFSDFQCSFCAQAHSIMRELLEKYPDKIYYIYRDFPIDELHPQARLAAEAGECAQEQGKFWPWHDKVFQNQASMQLNDLLNYARDVGMDMNAFGNCLESGRFKNEVEGDLRDGIDAGVKATPTFFVNGEKIEGVIPLDVWQQAIDTY